ncbi:copper transport protein ATOX1-like [Acanthaster planci]|uniref:Copper transport protein ATOX1 n=1 Tax=Acanthaster planci TaxID=133434 RepID=A0A8B7XWB7_ACAPL|nr:copper transport protein ATOX1-like [Acanthaster planci]
MATQKHVFNVEMTCEGCSGAVTRVLNKLGDKVAKFDVDLAQKKVVIESALSSDELLETLKKTGKETTYVGQEN